MKEIWKDCCKKELEKSIKRGLHKDVHDLALEKQRRRLKVTTRNQEQKNKESVSKIKDLYKFMDFGNRHIDNREEIKETNFANNKNDELQKILIANDYFSDWDSIALKQSTDPRINKAVNQDIYYNFSESNQVPEKLFADWDALKDIEFTEEQRNILESEEISQNPPLKIALFKRFMFIWRKVRKLRDVKRIQDRKGQKGLHKIFRNHKLLESKLENRHKNYKL